ncbi:Asp-tRNA(Asn)/Glu-tRNA(Gln) amidotransferase subunit GatA [candidate division KSB1 bacterium]|nr:Asp-tRNA(Asn)/Glu-tRNA(Gln) amidotransferase subunit GatA [candidate division KSB1 bacterium]
MTTLDYTRARELLEKKEITCSELVDKYFQRVNVSQLNGFITVFENSAREQAAQIDEKLKNGQAGRLAGMVLAVKDLIAMEGKKTTCGSNILSDYISPFDATVVQKLRAQDVIFLGKTNMDEFAMGSSNENSHYGPVKNPHNPECVPGGSSGGSAAVVADNLCIASLGSDTGGSIRQPASFCGVLGCKPTYGRVSRYGLVAYASSLDQIGPITKSVPDLSVLLEAICGHDTKDSTSADQAVPRFSDYLNRDVKGLRIGLPHEYFTDGLDADVAEKIQKVIDFLEQSGAKIIKLSLPHTEYAVATYYVIATAEASSNLARYDGARYGRRAESTSALEEMYVKSRTEGFGSEVKRRIMLGTYVLSAGYYDAYYRKAQKVRTLIKQDFDRAFQDVDCLLTPTSPTTAFKIGEKADDPLKMYLSDIYTVSLNLAGLPGVVVPVGKDGTGLPVGVQFIGPAFEESILIQIADFIEREFEQ